MTENQGANPHLTWEIIKCNIRRDTISYSHKEKKKSECEINAALKQHGFGPKILAWVKFFQSKSQSCIINSGNFCQFFNIARGVRQGCPLSPYIFILTIEVLANTIRKNNKIKGVSIFNHSAKLNLYAYDVTLFLHDDKSNIDECLNFINEFGTISGLKLNQSKTEYLNLGVVAKSQVKAVTLLGVKLCKNDEIIEDKFRPLPTSLWHIRKLLF